MTMKFLLQRNQSAERNKLKKKMEEITLVAENAERTTSDSVNELLCSSLCIYSANFLLLLLFFY
jgi:hypothetical protein